MSGTRRQVALPGFMIRRAISRAVGAGAGLMANMSLLHVSERRFALSFAAPVTASSATSSKLLVDILTSSHYLTFIDLFLAELWLPRDWHRA